MATQKQLQSARLRLAKQTAKKHGGRRPHLAGAFNDNGKQVICHGDYMVVYNDIVDSMPQADTSQSVFDYKKVLSQDVENDFLPVKHDLSLVGSSYKFVRFNGITVSLTYFTHITNSLINPKVYAHKTETRHPLYLKAENGVALIMPFYVDTESFNDIYTFGTTELFDGSVEAEKEKRRAVEEAEYEREKELRIQAEKQERQYQKDKTATEIKKAEEVVRIATSDLSEKIHTLPQTFVTIYGDDKYSDREISIIEYFAIKSGVTLPIRLIGWIREKLHSVEFTNGKYFSYKFYRTKGARQSETFSNYARLIFDDINESERLKQEEEQKTKEFLKKKLALIPENLQRTIRHYAGDPKIREWDIRWNDRVEYRQKIIQVTDTIFEYNKDFYRTVVKYGKNSNVLGVTIVWFNADSFVKKHRENGEPWHEKDTVAKITARRIAL